MPRSLPLWPRWAWLLLILLGTSYWFLPINGTVIVSSQPVNFSPQWPQITVEPQLPNHGDQVTVYVTDEIPWTHVRLTVNGSAARFVEAETLSGGTAWRWSWRFTMPDATSASSSQRLAQFSASTPGTLLEFFHNCDTGCQLRGQRYLESLLAAQQPLAQTVGLPTKLCVAFPVPTRNWYGRSGWAVDLTYALHADDPNDRYWSVDALAQRVALASAQGLRMLVRVDYAKDQSIPPPGDRSALDTYLAYLERLARDERLRAIYGYIIGSGYNTLDANGRAQSQPVSPEWYARIFNGYGEALTSADNVVQRVHAENPQVRLLVGPVRPWNSDQTGVQSHVIDVPWLNYMSTLVAALDEQATAKLAAGIPLGAPDGFALNVFGNPKAPEMGGRDPVLEPALSLPRATWNDAQAGFQVYRDWLAVINAYPTTAHLPVYINATNTFAASVPPVVPPTETLTTTIPGMTSTLPFSVTDISTTQSSTTGTPAETYPPGWLTTAYDVINREPQIQALCWFLDLLPDDARWQNFSLSQQQGQLRFAAEEFDTLLQQVSATPTEN